MAGKELSVAGEGVQIILNGFSSELQEDKTGFGAGLYNG